MVSPVDAVCIDNKVTVYTNIQDVVVSIQTPVPFSTAKKTLREGETWDIGSGYTLTIQSINVNSDTATLVFKKNGSVLDNKVVSGGQTYTHDSIFSANLDTVFVGVTTNITQFKYIYFLSEPYLWWKPQSGTTSMKSGDQWYWESNYIDFSEENMWKVSYGSIDGYLKQANETKTIDGRNCIEFTGVYRGGDITITSNIAEASFTIRGPGGYSKSGGGTSWKDYNVMGGSYTVNFMDVSGYTTSGVQEKTITSGSVTYFSATYSLLPTSTPPPTLTPTSIPTTTSYLGGEGATPTPHIPDSNIDTNVKVEVDPEDTIREINEENNETKTSIPLQPITIKKDLLQLIGVILIISGLFFTAFTTLKKDITIEIGVSDRHLKYVGGAGILLIIIGTYILLKCNGLI